MENIKLKIVGTHIYDYELEDDPMEFVTEGRMYTRGDVIYLTYDESAMSGMEGCTTRLILDGDSVKMTRRGSAVGVDTEIHFKKGFRYNGFYDTPYGPVEMEVLTNRLQNSVTAARGGAVDIDYNISFKGFSEGRSRLNIQVSKS